MGVLRALVGGQWVDVGGGGGEVYVGPDDPTLQYPGTELWYDTDDNVSGNPWNMPWGLIGRTSSIAGHTGIGTTPVDVAGMSLTVPTVVGRLLRVSAQIMSIPPSGAAFVMTISHGATVISQCNVLPGSAGAAALSYWSALFTTTAMSHTFKLTASTGAGTASILGSVNYPELLFAEDIGAA